MKIQKNKDVIVAGDKHNSVYFNRDGWLVRYKILHNGGRQIIDFILPSQMFGLHACLFKQSLYSVATITQTTLSAIPFSTIGADIDQSIEVSKLLFWSALCESTILGERLIDAARRTARERVSHLLLELFIRLKAVGRTDGMSFQAPLTQELIGDALGLTPVHVNRTIRSLREDKLVAIDGRVVTLCDFDALILLSDFDNSYLGKAAHAVLQSDASFKSQAVIF